MSHHSDSLRTQQGVADGPALLEPAPGAGDGRVAAAVDPVASFGGRVQPALRWAVEVGRWAPKPAAGHTRELWDLLASTAAIDVGVARVLEPHLDALAIIEQAELSDFPVELDRIDATPRSSWGVYAAEAAGLRLTATADADGWLLDGVKPWCSLAADVSHALVTAYTSEGMRRLFAVNMRAVGVHAAAGPWVSRGLQQVVSAPVRFERAAAVPVGGDGWYLTRPGFAWGGAGVAACWWGGAVGVGRALLRAAHSREPDQLALAHLGAVDTALGAARAALAQAARLVDRHGDGATSDEPSVIARRVRNVVAAAAEAVLTHVAHALGPAPLALDEEHARRVADLQIYLRQHHAERDEAAQGRDLLAGGGSPW